MYKLMYLLGAPALSVEVYPGEMKPGSCPRPPVHINDFYCYNVMLPSNVCTRHWVGPRKSASNRAPLLLRPALLLVLSYIIMAVPSMDQVKLCLLV